MTANAPAGDPFEALGDPNRRAIVELLGAGGRSVGELAEALPISRPAVSRHLRLLKEAGLVVEEAQGTRRIYRLHDAGRRGRRGLSSLQVWGDAVTRFRLMAENTETGAARQGIEARDDRAPPPHLRDRLPARARVRSVDDATLGVVAEGPFGVG